MYRSCVPFVFLFFCLFLSGLQNVAAQGLPPSQYKDSAIYKKLDVLAPKGFGAVLPEIEAMISAHNDQVTHEAILEWLRDNSTYHMLTGKDMATFDSFYFMAYSDILSNSARSYKAAGHDEVFKTLSETALLALFHFHAMSSMDAKRCKDLSVGGEVLKLSMFRFRALEDVMRAMPLKEMEDVLWRISLIVEERARHRLPNKAICSSGMARTQALLVLPGVEEKEVADPSYVGGKRTKLIAPAGYEYKPEYLSDEAWHASRQETHSALLAMWQQLYDSAIKKQ